MYPKCIKKILVGTDFSDRTGDAENFAQALAKSYGASVILVNGIEPIEGIEKDDEDISEFNEFYQVLRTRAEREATKRLERFKEQDISADYHIEIGPRWLVILEQAEAQNVDLIVLGRRTYNQNQSLVFGTTSQKVFFGATRPVLFVPPELPEEN